MAPKAKQQAQNSQPKSQPKAKAEAKVAAAEPPAPKAEAKAKAKAEAKAKGKAEPPAPAPAVAKSTPAADPKAKAKSAPAADPKAKAKGQAKQGAKSEPAAPPKAAKAVAPVPPVASAKGKSKAKGKAKPEPAPPPPPPEPEPVEEEIKKKKKTNHRGGRNKNKEETGPWPEDNIPVVTKPKEPPGRSAAQLASTAAEKDADLQAFRQRKASIAGDTKARKTELEALIKDIEKELSSKKAPHPHLRASSTQLSQNLTELQQVGETEMAEEVRKEMEQAKAQELFVALKTKLQELKGRCEEQLKAATAPVVAAVKAPREGVENSTAAPSRDVSDGREATALKRLGNLHKKDASGSKTESKTVELSTEITRYLFTPPHSFNGRFEQQFKVLVEPVRGPKGSGKGAKGAPPPKDLTITGLSAAEVNECEKALKALDFSGMKARDLENGLVMPRNDAKQRIEEECDVIIFKSQSQITIFGKSKNVADAWAKIEDSGYAKTLTVNPDLVKVIYSNKLLETWRSTGAQISLNQPPASDKGSSPAKITIQGKSREDTESVVVKVQDFVNNFGSETMKANADIVAKLFERANSSWLAKRFKEIQTASPEVSLRKSPEGVMLLGPKSKLRKVQAELKELMDKANLEPVKVPYEGDQEFIFKKETCDKIRDGAGLMEMYKLREEQVLVLLGDASAVAKAQTRIKEVVKNEGCVDEITISEKASKELLVNKGAKVQELQNKHATWIQVNKSNSTAKVYGSEEGVEATKKAIAAFAKKIDSIVERSMPVESGDMGRVIGREGSTRKKIETECAVEVKLTDTAVIIKGEQRHVAQAEKMIKEVLGKGPPAESKAKAPEPKAKAGKASSEERQAPAAKAKAKDFAKKDEDFPTLGGAAEPKAAQPTAKAWGKASQAEASPAPEASPAEAYPELAPSKATAEAAAKPAAEPEPAAAAAEEEEEEAGDCDDPFAMMGGMGEEQVYKVTLMEEAPKEDEE